MKLALKNIINNIPKSPGCYLFYSENNIIYIGKSKQLQSRVSSYFIKRALTGRQHKFINSIDDIKYIATTDETEALLLEENLIKKHRPYYNTLITDDKKYPYIVITDEKYPRLLYLRQLKSNQKNAFGPFPDGSGAKQVFDILNQVLMFRKCVKLPTKPCIYYHLKQCYAPCFKDIDPKIYQKKIEITKRFFKGETKPIIQVIEKQMRKYADLLQFEEANKLKELIVKINNYNNDQVIVFKDKLNRDCLGWYYENNYLSTVILFYRSGKLVNQVNGFGFVYDTKDIDQQICKWVNKVYLNNTIPKFFITNKKIVQTIPCLKTTKVIIPKQGKNQNILNLAFINAKEQYQVEINKKFKNKETNYEAQRELEKVCNIENLQKIDIIDNSFGGKIFVTAIHNIDIKTGMRTYRKYNLAKIKKEITNDFDAMKYALRKHYLIKNNLQSELLIVDGGWNQMQAAKLIKKELNLKIKIAGLVKDSKHNTKDLYLENNKVIHLNDYLSLKRYLSKLQTNIDISAKNYYHKRLNLDTFKTELQDIPTIGTKTEKKLLDYFNNIFEIKNATLETLTNVVTKSQGERIITYFKTKKN